MMPAEPARIWSPASITAFMPEPHILLTVVAGTLMAMPAATAAWRAGAWPRPAGSTQPKMTSSMASGPKPGIGEGGPRRGRTELRGGDRAQHALEGADRGAACGSDDELCSHWRPSWVVTNRPARHGRVADRANGPALLAPRCSGGAVYAALFLQRKIAGLDRAG